MAHIGKFYKLLVRRDLCVGCLQNNRGLPEAWRVGGEIRVTAPTLKIFTVPVKLLTLITDEWSSAPSWESEPFVIAGHTARLRFVWGGWDFDRQVTKLFMHVWDGVSRGNSLPNFIVGNRCDDYHISTSFGNQTMNQIDKVWWGGTAVDWRMDINPAGWQYWPPP